MNDFHGLIKKLLMAWLPLYALLLLPGLLKGMFIFLLSDFTLPAKHYLDIIFIMYRGALWFVPTAFLLVAYFCSRSKGSTSSY